MRIVNAVEIAQACQRMVASAVHLVVIRHAHKQADGGLRAALSPTGCEQVYRLRVQTAPFFGRFILHDRLRLLSSTAPRCMETLLGLSDRLIRDRLCIAFPTSLDLPFFGQHDEDYRAILRFATERGISQKEASVQIDASGYQRVGEKFGQVMERMRQGFSEEVRKARNEGRIVVYCGHSPEIESALELDGFLGELEIVALTQNGQAFTPVVRFKPEFAD